MPNHATLLQRDQHHLLHPLHHPADHEAPLIIESGEGIWLRTVDGREYIDGLAGLWNVLIGHGNTELAEAARRINGVDVRLFGFTDATIYDAGDDQTCHASALVAEGGNNDAAGLWHVAQVAAGSRRAARLLVMISDGLPTECSVAAVRNLVTSLSKRGFLCAQIALRALPEEDVSFPEYIVMEEEDFGRSVRRFGSIIARLVKKTLFVGAFASNKVQGFALLKGAGVLSWPPVLAYFVSAPWQLAFGLDPLYWPVKLFWMLEAGDPLTWLYYLVGLAYQSALVWLLLQRYRQVIHR